MDAGADTTAIALTNVLYYLIKHPAVLNKLKKEVDNVLTGEEIAPYAKVKILPYLKACLDESPRLSPPVSRGLEQKTPSQGMQILGEQIAGGVTVSAPTYVVHRDPILFHAPDDYRAERWLGEPVETKGMRAAFIPFTTGARACLGWNITTADSHCDIGPSIRLCPSLSELDLELGGSIQFMAGSNAFEDLEARLLRQVNGNDACIYEFEFVTDRSY